MANDFEVHMATIGSRGDKLNLLIRQGATFGPVSARMTDPNGEPVDLSCAMVRAMVKKSYSCEDGFEMMCDVSDPLDGKFIFTMHADVTAMMSCGATPNDPASQYVWDLEIEFADGTVMPVFFGAAKVAPEATRESEAAK